MAEDVSEKIFVMLCDWRGNCTWASPTNGAVNVGEFVWTNLEEACQKKLQSAPWPSSNNA